MGITSRIQGVLDEFLVAQRWHIIKLNDLMRVHNLSGAVQHNNGTVPSSSHPFHEVS
jgi:hypothetical protein